MNNDILCLFYSQFNIEKGGEIITQYPQGFLNNEEFGKISEYIVPRQELCNKFLSLKLGSTYLMGFPINLISPNYNRAKFQFNFCLIVKEEGYNYNKEIYEALLSKVGKTFEEYEILFGYDLILHNTQNIKNFTKSLYESLLTDEEIISIPIYFFIKGKSKFLEETKDKISRRNSTKISLDTNIDEESKLDICKQKSTLDINKIEFEKLNSNDKVYYKKSVSNIKYELLETLDFSKFSHIEKIHFFFKFYDLKYVKTNIKDYLVPIFINTINRNDFNLLCPITKKVISEIDGISFIKKISVESEIEIAIVKNIIYTLILKKVIILVDIFQYRNIYRHSSKFLEFYDNSSLYDEFIYFYSINRGTVITNNNLDKNQNTNTNKEGMENDLLLNEIYNNNFKSYFEFSDKLSDTKEQNNLELTSSGRCYILNDKIINHDALFSNLDYEQLFTLYSLLCNCQSVQLFVENHFFYNFDVSVFIAFGVYKKLIDRVHVYGIIKQSNTENRGTELYKLLKGMLDGYHSMDEVCVETGKSFKEIITLVRSINGSHLIYK